MDQIETWQNAQGYCSLYGTVPSTFSTVLRSLRGDYEKGLPELSSGSSYLALRLLRSPSIYAPIFHAANAILGPNASISDLSSAEVLKLFKPLDLAGIFGLFYFYRKARKLCESEDWSPLNDPILKCADLGILVAKAIPIISCFHAMTSVTLRLLAVGTLLLHDKKGYTEYRRQLRASGFEFNSEFESKRWGCTSAQIGSLLIQSIGLGANLTTAYVIGADEIAAEHAQGIENDIYCFRIARIWVQSLFRNADIPDITHKGTFYPDPQALENLLREAKTICESGVGKRPKWIESTRESINPSIAPIYFKNLKGSGFDIDGAESEEEIFDLPEDNS